MGLSFWSEKKSEAAVSQELLLFRSKNDLVIGDQLCNTHWSSLSRQARPLGIVALSVVSLSFTVEVNSKRSKKRKQACLAVCFGYYSLCSTHAGGG